MIFPNLAPKKKKKEILHIIEEWILNLNPIRVLILMMRGHLGEKKILEHV